MKQRMSRMVPFAVVIGAALALGAACATSDQTARRSVETAFAANAGAGEATGAVNLALAMPIPEHPADQSAEVVSGRS